MKFYKDSLKRQTWIDLAQLEAWLRRPPSSHQSPEVSAAPARGWGWAVGTAVLCGTPHILWLLWVVRGEGQAVGHGTLACYVVGGV